MSKLDSLYRRMLITRFFEKGWGKPENLQRLFEFRKLISKREECYRLIPSNYPIEIVREEKQSDCTILEGYFHTPLEYFLPGLVPKESQKASFQVVLPNKWKNEKYKPVCIHLAGTGDHYFWRRRNFIVKPLLREANMGAIILENPFYGSRKPENQVRSNLHNVSDIFVMGGCLVLECLVLLHWCEKHGFGPLGITGLSMGGHMASLAATNWPKPLVLVPCLSWSTAAAVFTTGVMSQSINWDMLETQYFSDGNYCEKLSKMVTVVDDAFTAGQNFIQNFSQSLNELRSDIKYVNTSTPTKSNKSPFSKQKNTIQIDEANTLQLSPSLYQKLISEKKFELSNSEINELNEKIKDVHLINKFMKNPTAVSTNTILSSFTKSKKDVQALKPPNKKWNLTNLMSYIYPKSLVGGVSSIDVTKTNWWERDALQFMRGVMDECTHLKNFSVPFDTSLIIAVCAKDDAYVPRSGCSSLEEIWPGVEVRYLDAGHVSAYVLHQKLFRACIIEAFERAKKQTFNKGENLVPTFTYEEFKERYKNVTKQN